MSFHRPFRDKGHRRLLCVNCGHEIMSNYRSKYSNGVRTRYRHVIYGKRQTNSKYCPCGCDKPERSGHH